MIDYARLMNYTVEQTQAYSARDVMLYALGIGLGNIADRPDDLRFVYEQNLQALPTFASVLGYPGLWIKDPELGLTWDKVLNGEQGLIVHRQFPPEGHIIGRFRVSDVVDKGEGKGALIYTARDILDEETKSLLATVTNTVFARADGGFGGGGAAPPAPTMAPDREPDFTLDFATIPQAALIYRLSGDYNPLHADPAIAQSAGFGRPILHGAATWGIAGYALMTLLCGGDPTRFHQFNARLSAPVYPGETISTDVWRTRTGHAAFRCRVAQRNVTVLSHGEVVYE